MPGVISDKEYLWLFRNLKIKAIVGEFCKGKCSSLTSDAILPLLAILTVLCGIVHILFWGILDSHFDLYILNLLSLTYNTQNGDYYAQCLVSLKNCQEGFKYWVVSVLSSP